MAARGNKPKHLGLLIVKPCQQAATKPGLRISTPQPAGEEKKLWQDSHSSSPVEGISQEDGVPGKAEEVAGRKRRQPGLAIIQPALKIRSHGRVKQMRKRANRPSKEPPHPHVQEIHRADGVAAVLGEHGYILQRGSGKLLGTNFKI